jgi:hypothetical protein
MKKYLILTSLTLMLCALTFCRSYPQFEREMLTICNQTYSGEASITACKMGGMMGLMTDEKSMFIQGCEAEYNYSKRLLNICIDAGTQSFQARQLWIKENREDG